LVNPLLCRLQKAGRGRAICALGLQAYQQGKTTMRGSHLPLRAARDATVRALGACRATTVAICNCLAFDFLTSVPGFSWHQPTPSKKDSPMTQLKAVIFGAIGTVAEVADLERQAYNAAFKQAGLDWKWSAIAYKEFLKTDGGEERIRAFRDAVPARADVDEKAIKKLHEAKKAGVVELIAQTKLIPRAGVKELMDACIAAEVKLAWCAPSSADSVKALNKALAKLLPLKDLAATVTLEGQEAAKTPAKGYSECLEALGLKASDVVAIEDTPFGVEAAKAAGIFTVATPGEMAAGQDFSAADLVVTSLSSVTLEELQKLLEQASEPAFANSGNS
jgi:beta-phosphoglucomutase-like phosphatase (HAD superfamily)